MPLKHYTEDAPRSLSDIVTLELNMSWCREGGMLAPTAAVTPMGAVLALDESGNYVPFMAALASGESAEAPETPEEGEPAPALYADKAVAVLISKDLPVSAEPQPCTVLRRGACVAAPNLSWLPEVTDAQKQLALSQLSALGIVPKD